MIAAMAMITSSVQRQRRGSFMSAIAAVQHLSTGVGACFGGLIMKEAPDLRPLHSTIIDSVAAATSVSGSGISALFDTLVVPEAPDHHLLRFPVVGCIAAVITLSSLWFASRVRAVDEEPATDLASSLAAAAEATCDVGEPIVEM